MNHTKVDWWALRSQGTPEAHQVALGAAFGEEVRAQRRKGGYMGYECSATLSVRDLDVGLVAWGGANQKGWTYTSITGAGCAWVRDWDRAQEAFDSCPGYEPRRVDVALDVFDGSSSFDATLQAYRAGGFSPPGSGRPPKCEPMKPERDQDSAIIRIGNRASNKFLRGYEKGKQLLAGALTSYEEDDLSPDNWRLARVTVEDEHGEAVSVPMWDWWRLELELKPQTAALPEDVIDRRDQYFAGAYPYLGELLSDVDSQALVMPRERGPQLDLAMALETMRKQWGSTLYTALVAYEGDIGAVWSKVVGKQHNERLVKAGVLMVEHST
jgi:DNA relaxase NicK